jgi:hypothetical protein
MRNNSIDTSSSYNLDTAPNIKTSEIKSIIINTANEVLNNDKPKVSNLSSDNKFAELSKIDTEKLRKLSDVRDMKLNTISETSNSSMDYSFFD